MRLISTIAAAAVMTTVAGSAFAGGFATEIVETPVVVIDPVVAPAGSLPGWVVPAAVAVALIAVATSGSDDDYND